MASLTHYDRTVTRARLGVQEVSLRAWALTGDPVARWMLGSPRTDVYALYERIRRRGPVVASRTGVLALTSVELCEQVLRDPLFGVQAVGERPRDDPMARILMPAPVSGSFWRRIRPTTPACGASSPLRFDPGRSAAGPRASRTCCTGCSTGSSAAAGCARAST